MIQFNLLPDVKLEYLRARNRQRLAIMISSVVSAAFLAVLIILVVVVKVSQPYQMKAVSSDIEKQNKEIHKIENLDKILTVQNQLKSLPELHDKKAISSRLFGFLKQVTPTQATISDVEVDLEANTMSIQGNADSLNTVNKFTDTLKFTTFRSNGADKKEGDAFSKVVLTSFGVSSGGGQAKDGNKAVSYKIDFSFDPTIFTNVKDDQGKSTDVNLIVPNKITTRSALDQPGILFDSQPTKNPQERR